MPGDFDMRRMQEDAARRAREMQARARIPQPRRNNPNNNNNNNNNSQEEQRQKQEAPAPPPPPPAPAQPPALGEPEQGPGSMLSSLFQDKERTIILALLILLGSEEGSHELMFALLFLLM